MRTSRVIHRSARSFGRLTRSGVALAAMATSIACATRAAAPGGSASAGSRDSSATPVAPAPSLASFGAREVAVAPIQALLSDTIGWSTGAGDQSAFLRSVDDELERALRDSVRPAGWVYPPQLARSARRNPTVVSDPYQLAVAGIGASQWKAGAPLREPLASQLRAMVALTPARYVLIPVSVRFEPAGAGAARASLHAAVVDARGSIVLWAGNIHGDTVSARGPAATYGAVHRLAALFRLP